MDKENKFCENCGANINMDAEFCSKCGNKQANMKTQLEAVDVVQPVKESNRVESNVQSGEKVGITILWGWVTATMSLFIPIIGVIAIVFGSLVIKKKHTVSGIVLLVFSILFTFWGMTGFAEGFTQGFLGAVN
ncbi:zinc-ribbon domain-containing protein [Levilactobacillus enshiensis]|uniref:zinc-ribbon domain-containing protein n=1 Tax=Levilactobacillus enshiensis TaxID=2590213 RepID=UPI001CDC5010|nr:zinc ribbon domain-containing protein [Levilactobacillus enshiensis]